MRCNGMGCRNCNGCMSGFGEVAPPEIQESIPVYESARVVAGGGKWVRGEFVGTWNPDAGTLLNAARNPAFAQRLRKSGANLGPAGSASVGKVALAIGAVALVAFVLSRRS